MDAGSRAERTIIESAPDCAPGTQRDVVARTLDLHGPHMAAPSTSPGIAHVDLDAFFASVEQLQNPALRGKPVVVGGRARRGVVAAASYEARQYGIRSAIPMARALALCPDAIVIAPRMDVYRHLSEQVMAILRSSGAPVEQVSVDEAYLDLSDAGRERAGGAAVVAAQLRRRIRRDVGLVASVGVGPNKLLAKLASEAAKPDGMLIVASDDVAEFLGPLRISDLPGVGPASTDKLARYGIRTVDDMTRMPLDAAIAALGVSAGRNVWDMAQGTDTRPVVTERNAKSISQEETFFDDIAVDGEAARHAVGDLAVRVAGLLTSRGVAGRTVTLKLRWADFRTQTRSRTLHDPTDQAATIAAVAAELLDGIGGAGDLRLLGVSVSGLTGLVQPGLFDPPAASPAPPPGPGGRTPGARTAGGPVTFPVGARVTHDVFGSGTVERSGPDAVVVRFADGRVRTLDLAYAPLHPT